MSNLLREARQFFSSMPEEVVDTWLAERVESRGWPPSSSSWHALLRFYSPSEWQAFSWEKREIDLGSVNYSSKSRDIIVGLAAACFRGARNGYSDVENSKLRMGSIYSHLIQTGTLPGSVVLISNDEWEIVDGCHRISCYTVCRNSPDHAGKILPSQSAWVATPAKV